MKITVASVGYVILSLAVPLVQNHEVTYVTTTESKILVKCIFEIFYHGY